MPLALSFLILLILSPIVVLILSILLIRRCLISLFLRIKHGEEYFELLPIADVAPNLDPESKFDVQVLLIVKTVDNFNTFVQKLKYCLEQKSSHISFRKLAALRRQCCGVEYLIKNDFKVEDYVKIIDLPENIVNIDKVELEKIITKSAADSVKDRFIEFRVLNKEIIIGKSGGDNLKKFAVIVKFDHGLCDGNHFSKFMALLATDEQDLEISRNYVSIYNFGIIFLIWNYFSLCLKTLEDNFKHTIRCKSIKNAARENNKIMMFHNICKFYCEDDDKLFKILNEIRQKLGNNVSFSDIVITALGASLSDFYEKRNQEVTEFYSTVPIGFESTDSRILVNDAGPIFIKLCLESNKKISIFEKLKLIHEQNVRHQRVVKAQVNRTIARSVSLFPAIFKTNMVRASPFADSIISLIPPYYDNLKLFGGEVENVVGFMKGLPKMRLILTEVTYKRRLQFGLTLNANYFDENSAQEIMNGVYKCIGKLHNLLKEKDQ